jgi:hypothetical protein
MSPPLLVLLGIRTGYDYDAKAWSLGGQIKLPIGGRPGGLEIIPSGDLFFNDSTTDWQINLDIAFRLLVLYGGVGLAYLNRNFQQPDEKDRKSGSNYFIGMPLPLPRLPIMLFIEARWTEVDDKQVFRLVVGVNIPLGRR